MKLPITHYPGITRQNPTRSHVLQLISKSYKLTMVCSFDAIANMKNSTTKKRQRKYKKIGSQSQGLKTIFFYALASQKQKVSSYENYFEQVRLAH